MDKRVAIKVKYSSSREVLWESLPAMYALSEHGWDLARQIAELDNVYEVRVNYVGSQQGHYIAGEKFRH